MIKQLKLFKRCGGWSDRFTICHVWYLCDRQVQRYFTLPKDCSQAFFTAYTKPGVDRVKVELIEEDYDVIIFDGRPQPAWDWQVTTQQALKNLLTKHGTFYVGCEYEV